MKVTCLGRAEFTTQAKNKYFAGCASSDAMTESQILYVPQQKAQEALDSALHGEMFCRVCRPAAPMRQVLEIPWLDECRIMCHFAGSCSRCRRAVSLQRPQPAALQVPDVRPNSSGRVR